MIHIQINPIHPIVKHHRTLEECPRRIRAACLIVDYLAGFLIFFLGGLTLVFCVYPFVEVEQPYIKNFVAVSQFVVPIVAIAGFVTHLLSEPIFGSTFGKRIFQLETNTIRGQPSKKILLGRSIVKHAGLLVSSIVIIPIRLYATDTPFLEFDSVALFTVISVVSTVLLDSVIIMGTRNRTGHDLIFGTIVYRWHKTIGFPIDCDLTASKLAG